jgi:YidC/Oxa1 family membrane protein insertase
MDIKRTILWAIFFVSAIMLFDNWQRDHGRPSMFFPNPTHTQTSASSPASSTPGSEAIATPSAAAPAAGTAPSQPQAAAQLIHFSTDVYDGEIDTRGGTLEKLVLTKNADPKGAPLNETLFDHTAKHTYLARTGLIGGDFPNHNDIFTPVPGPLTLSPDQKTLKVSLESPVKGGLKVVKTYTFTRGSYVIGVDTKVENVGSVPVKPSLYMELVRDSQPVDTPRFSHTFLGPALYTNAHHFQKITFSDIDKNKVDVATSADNGGGRDSSMHQRRQTRAYGAERSALEPRNRNPGLGLIARRENLAPWPDDHATAERAPAVRMRAALAGREHVGLVFDRPCSQQQFPMREAGGMGERGRHRDDVGSRRHAIKLGKAKVIANR